MEYKGCVASTGGIHSVLGNWPRRCDEFGVIYDCDSANMYVAPTMDCASFGCTPTGMIPTGTCNPANTPTTLSCVTNNSQDLTTTNPLGECDASAGTCS